LRRAWGGRRSRRISMGLSLWRELDRGRRWFGGGSEAGGRHGGCVITRLVGWALPRNNCWNGGELPCRLRVYREGAEAAMSNGWEVPVSSTEFSFLRSRITGMINYVQVVLFK
jgi:hypothetical protein